MLYEYGKSRKALARPVPPRRDAPAYWSPEMQERLLEQEAFLDDIRVEQEYEDRQWEARRRRSRSRWITP